MRDYLVGETITFEADAHTDGYLETDHSYSWSIDGSSYATNPKTHAFTAEGTYTSAVTATNTVTGGTAQAQVTVNVVEPANTNWQALAALPPQSIRRPIHARLNDGKTLIVYGTKSWEFDGSAWVAVGDLSYPRYRGSSSYNTGDAYPRAITAKDGRVWVFGNTNLGSVDANCRSVEVYDPTTKTWSVSTYTLPVSSLSYDDVLPVYIGGCVYVGISSNTGGILTRYVVDYAHSAIAEGLPSPGGPTGVSGGLSPIVRVTDTKIGVMFGTTFRMCTLDVTASASVNWVGPFDILGAGRSLNSGVSCVPDGIGGVYIVTDGHILHNALDGTASVQLDSEYIGGSYLYYLMHIRKLGNFLFMVGEVPFWNGSSFAPAYGSTFFNLSSNTWSKTRCKKFTTRSPSGVYSKFYTGSELLLGKPIVFGTYPAASSPWPAVQFLDFKVSDD